MSRQPLAGTWQDPNQSLEDIRAAFPYFRIEDCRADVIRQGNEFAHPYVEDAMSLDLLDAMSAQVDLDVSAEQMAQTRALIYDKANKDEFDRINADHPEFEEYGWWEEHDVDGCPEEPDAPKVHVLMRRLRSSYATGPYPTVLVVACGGLYLNNPYFFVNAPITKYLGCQLVSSRIRTYPDAEYPSAINDLHATYQWMVDNADDLQIDTDRIIIVGASSGGHLASALPFRLKRYGWCGAPMPRGVTIYDGFFDDRESTRSMRTLNKSWSGIVNRAANMRYMGRNFASGFVGPEAYANHAYVEECRNLPPYAIFCNQDNAGCDSSIEFAQKLNEAGVYCNLMMAGGCTHAMPMDALARLTPFAMRETDYEPTLGTDVVSRIEAFYIGSIEDFIKYDLRRP